MDIKKIVEWISSHKTITALIIIILYFLILLFVQIPYWLGSHYTLISTNYGAENILNFTSNYLTFIGTVFLGFVTVYQNYKLHTLTEKTTNIEIENAKKNLVFPMNVINKFLMRPVGQQDYKKLIKTEGCVVLFDISYKRDKKCKLQCYKIELYFKQTNGFNMKSINLNYIDIYIEDLGNRGLDSEISQYRIRFENKSHVFKNLSGNFDDNIPAQYIFDVYAFASNNIALKNIVGNNDIRLRIGYIMQDINGTQISQEYVFKLDNLNLNSEKVNHIPFYQIIKYEPVSPDIIKTKKQ